MKLFTTRSLAACGSNPMFTRLLAVQGDPQKTILEEAVNHDVVIVGAGAVTEPHSFFLGPVMEQIALSMDKSLVVVKTPETFGTWKETRRVVEPKNLSDQVDQWFAENTFHRREFADLAKLVDLKRKQNLTISLGLPALNEAETVGKIIQIIKTTLFDEVPLLDEIVLIDSGSTDDTVKIAKDLGIPVVVHQEILPDEGAFRGKGEALPSVKRTNGIGPKGWHEAIDNLLERESA